MLKNNYRGPWPPSNSTVKKTILTNKFEKEGIMTKEVKEKKAESIADYFKYADGCIVGSYLKVDGYTWNPVDPNRAKKFIDNARSA